MIESNTSVFSILVDIAFGVIVYLVFRLVEKLVRKVGRMIRHRVITWKQARQEKTIVVVEQTA